MNKKKIIIIAILSIFCIGMIMGSASAVGGYYHNVKQSKYASVSTDNLIKNYKKTNIRSEKTGVCTRVIDGDTVYVSGIGKIRLSQVDTPEKGYKGYNVSTYFTKKVLLGKKVGINIDSKQKKSYGRWIAVVIIKGRNFNQILLKERLAQILYFKKSEFNPYKWVGSSYKTTTYTSSKKSPSSKKYSSSSSKKYKGSYYVASINSDKRHYNTCTYTSKIKSNNKVTFKTKYAAIEAGKTKSCSICHS